MTAQTKKLGPERSDYLFDLIGKRFEENMDRHRGLRWQDIQGKLETNPEKLWSLNEMEVTGGEPDVIGLDQKTGMYLFVDCATESPKGRRSLCYDHEALESRKTHKPKSSAIYMALEMGIELITEDQYLTLQQLGIFDTKTSSWLKTPDDIRKRGGAIFGDCRFGRVFIYHNGAESYYGARGFRGILAI